MFWNRRPTPAAGAFQGPRGHRAYVVGDVHGRLDLLDRMLEDIGADHRRRGPAKAVIVFLGDLIDRGPQSAEVVERLRTFRPGFARLLFLMGNHEEVLLRILDGETEIVPDWLRFGGAECARSYGLDPAELKRSSPAEAARLLAAAVPPAHRAFLQGFADSASFGDYLFVHAGVRPGVALDRQTPRDMRWIRAPFLADEGDHGHLVVHGHSIAEEVEIRPNRIGLDTGAYRTGLLSALGIEGADRWVLQARQETAETAKTASVANFSEAY